MDKAVEKTGRTVEEALQAALKELGVTADMVKYEVLEEAGKKGLFGLFGSKQARIKVMIKDAVKPVQDEDAVIEPGFLAADPASDAKDFLQSIFSCMQLEVMIEKFVQADGAISLQLHGPDLGILIGKHGQTLDALQYLAGLVANRQKGERVKIIVDVENYRKRRAETLARLAMRLSDKVKRQGERVMLEPMNPHERKVIHITLQDERRVTTYSEGEEPYRYVVIAPRQ